jgi:hypothetical protein
VIDLDSRYSDGAARVLQAFERGHDRFVYRTLKPDSRVDAEQPGQAAAGVIMFWLKKGVRCNP